MAMQLRCRPVPSATQPQCPALNSGSGHLLDDSVAWQAQIVSFSVATWGTLDLEPKLGSVSFLKIVGFGRVKSLRGADL